MTPRRLLASAVLALASVLLIAAKPNDAGPSVLVRLAPLRLGTLPHVITAYGKAEPAAEARRRVMAPIAAEVTALYVHRGEEVAADAPLLRLIPSPASAAAYAQARSAVGVAKELVARTRTLARQHLATGQQLAAAEKSAADATAALAALQAEGAAGPQTLRAPFRAIVTGLAASPGTMVQAGADLVDLARPDSLVLRAGVVPAEAKAVAPGDTVALTPLGGKSRFSGRVRLRAAMVEAGSGLVPVEIGLPAGKALVGEMLRADITTGEARGYVVPHAAILVDDRGDSYVVQAVKGRARTVMVRVLAGNGDEDVIAGALDRGAPVVLAGNHQLKTGMRVRTADTTRGRRR